jgi:hypothetical protein
MAKSVTQPDTRTAQERIISAPGIGEKVNYQIVSAGSYFSD